MENYIEPYFIGLISVLIGAICGSIGLVMVLVSGILAKQFAKILPLIIARLSSYIWLATTALFLCSGLILYVSGLQTMAKSVGGIWELPGYRIFSAILIMSLTVFLCLNLFSQKIRWMFDPARFSQMAEFTTRLMSFYLPSLVLAWIYLPFLYFSKI
jgi:hypothetical protein